MSHLACYISNALLALMLVGLYLSSKKERTQLMNRLLAEKGIETIPEESPLANALERLGAKHPSEVQSPQVRQKIKESQERIRFNIPGMEGFRK